MKNIILLILDCLRKDAVSYYNPWLAQVYPTTPFIDTLAKDSYSFTNAFANAPWTLPSHASIFSGLYPNQHQAQQRHLKIADGCRPLAEELSATGYYTIGFSNNNFVGGATGLSRGFNVFYEWSQISELTKRTFIDRILYNSFWKLDSDRKRRVYDQSQRTIQLALHELKHHLEKSRDSFFLFINLMDAHLPYDPPKDLRERFLAHYAPPHYSSAVAAPYRKSRDFARRAGEIGEEEFKLQKAFYLACASTLDRHVESLVNGLKAMAVWDETMLILTADHGENIGEHGLVDHQFCLYNTLLHVPLIIRVPSSVGQPRVIDDIVETRELHDIILAWASEDKKENFDLYDFLLSMHFPPHAVAMYDLPEFSLARWKKNNAPINPAWQRELYSIRTQDWKYIHTGDGKHELYHIQEDATELNNLFLDHAYIEVVEELQNRLSQYMCKDDVSDDRFDEPDFDREVKKRLQALGYL
jgi:arylsulfatase A-like enzyme